MTSTAIPERRLYEIERRELAADVLEQPKPRALYICLCGQEFFGPRAASDWVAHTVPCCAKLLAREQLKRELEQSRVKKQRIEYAMTGPLLDAIENLGYVRTIESIAALVECIAERDKRNAECWKERANALVETAGIGEERS